MKCLITCFTLLLCFTLAQAQHLIQGTINDATTGQPVPFVSVGIKGAVQGTVTNEQGNFAISAATLPATLVVSHISYQGKEIVINNEQAITITLQPVSVQLQEVTVGNPALTIMKEVAARAKKDAVHSYYLKTFFRQLITEGGDPAFFSESFMDAQWQNWSLTQYNITNSRYLEGNYSVTFTNMAPLSLACSGYVNNSLITYPVNRKPDSLYKFKLKSTFKTNGREIDVISCELKNDDYTHTAFVGDYYVDAESYAVLKLDGSLMNFKMTVSGPLNIKVKEVKVTSQYKLDADSNSVLDYTTFNLKTSLKAGFVGLKQLNYTAKLFAVAKDATINQQTLQPVTISHLQTDRDRFIKAAYDAGFWKKNAVIQRTTEEDATVSNLEQFRYAKGNLNK